MPKQLASTSNQVLVDYNKISSEKSYTPEVQGHKTQPSDSSTGNGRIRRALALTCVGLACATVYNFATRSAPPTAEIANTNTSPDFPTTSEATVTLAKQEITEDPQPQFFFNSNNLIPAAPAPSEVPFVEVERIDDFLPLPGPAASAPLTSPVPLTAAEPELANDYSQEPSQILVVIEKGDTLSGVLANQDLSSAEIAKVVALPEVTEHLTNIRPGQEILINLDGGRRLTGIIRQVSLTDTLTITREADNKFSAKLDVKPLNKQVKLAELTMESSLFIDGARAGLSESVIMDLYSIFQWTVDFNREVRAGDRLTVLHEAYYKDGEKVKDGNILAAEYHSARNIHSAYRHVSDGKTGYYDAKGQSLKKQFLRNPVKARITSRFNLKRKHPIRHTIRAHKGVDYGAPTGTPVTSAGDGRVLFAGVRGSYGNVIEIQHGDRHSTLYAHLNNFAENLKAGKRVSQGEVIGYVGRTGLATGPHLHYEFRVDGVHHDPQKVELGGSIPLEPEQLARFKLEIQPLRAHLASVRQDDDTLAMR